MSRLVRYTHRALLQVQLAFDGVKTTLRVGQKKFVCSEKKGEDNLKLMRGMDGDQDPNTEVIDDYDSYSFMYYT